MIQRIKSVQPLPDYMLSIVFDNGRHVLYDVKEDMILPGYDARRRITGFFSQVQLAPSCTCAYWNDQIDLPSDILYTYGISV